MEPEIKYRVGTLISCSINSREMGNNPISDLCAIYEDPNNDGYYIALSRQTSKVGFGKEPEEAYADLVIGLVKAIRYQRQNQLKASIGVASTKEFWERINSVSRMPLDLQNELLKEICTRLPSCRYGGDSVVREELEITQFELAAICDDD